MFAQSRLSLLFNSSRSQLHQSIFYYCLLAIVLTLPFSIPVNSICIIALTLNWILEGQFAVKARRLLNNKIALAFIGLYILHIIGMLYTSNQYTGRYDLEKKLTLLLFPLVCATTKQLAPDRVHHLLKGFVIICVVSLFISLSGAIYNYIHYHNVEIFFYHQLGSFLGINAVYLALYLTFSSFILVYFLIIEWKNWKLVKLLLLLFCLSGIVLLSSKTLIISLFLFSNIFFIRLLARKTNRYIGITAIIVANIIGGLLIANIPYTRDRFYDAINFERSVLSQKKYVYNTPFTGLSLRLVIWKFSLEILSDNHCGIWGVGTGDGQDLLDQKYRNYNLYQGTPGTADTGYQGYDAHNQFVAILLALGLVGIVWFLACLLLTTHLAYHQANYLYLSFIFLFIISCITESLLCNQKGIIFYGLFNAIFAFHLSRQNQQNPHQTK